MRYIFRQRSYTVYKKKRNSLRLRSLSKGNFQFFTQLIDSVKRRPYENESNKSETFRKIRRFTLIAIGNETDSDIDHCLLSCKEFISLATYGELRIFEYIFSLLFFPLRIVGLLYSNRGSLRRLASCFLSDAEIPHYNYQMHVHFRAHLLLQLSANCINVPHSLKREESIRNARSSIAISHAYKCTRHTHAIPFVQYISFCTEVLAFALDLRS